ncbi:Ig-like domain-containing protein [Treponema sp.]|uniref:Ig-like domain-containing protein n=1 Tax=Treponema sp. TaxID=166 RepID=UPI00257F2343|nr:Ig-like domain-containing protein [Treponema sp.]MBE6353724.1 hypothetical protein [Treponema sp.]
MKKIIKAAAALTCASLLGGAVFAQDADFEEERVSAPVPVSVSERRTVNDSLQMSETVKQISLHKIDYNTDFPELSVKGYNSRDLKWSSSNMDVVKVDQRGRLFPNSIGKATVTAVSSDGKKAECEVEVTKYGPKPTSAGLSLSTGLTGDASVTWGFDLDTGRSGFTTDQNIKLKMDVLNLGEVWAGDNKEALPVWGEIRIYTKGDPVRYMVDSDSETDPYVNSGDFAIMVDRAKVHVGDAYITLFDKDYSDLGYVNYTTGSDVAFSFMAADPDYRYGHLTKRNLHTYLSSYDEDAEVFGLSAGYEMPNVFKLQADVASTMEWVAGSDNHTSDTADPSHNATDYVYKVYGEFNWIKNLSVQAGFSSGVLGKDSTIKPDLRFGAQTDYQWNFYDIFYLKPSAGVTMMQLEGMGDVYPLYSAGIMLGWEDRQSAFDYYSCKYSRDDYGPYPGLAFAMQYADSKIAEYVTYFSAQNLLTTFTGDDLLILHGSFNTGNNLLVKNLEAVGAVDIVNVLSDRCVIGYTLGAAYYLPLGEHGFGVKPKFLVTNYHDTYNDLNDYCYIKGGVEIGFERVTLSIDYLSNDIINGYNDGTDYNRMGCIETKVKVSF